MVKWWLGLNVLFIFAVLIWSWQKDTLSAAILTAKGSAQFALLFFLINFNLYFIFWIIRKSKNRNVRIKFAKISRKLMKLHIPIAITGTSLILIHAIIMLSKHPLSIYHLKMASGLLTLLGLSILLLTGYRRHKKASRFRRKSHIILAFTFMAFILLHVFVY